MVSLILSALNLFILFTWNLINTSGKDIEAKRYIIHYLDLLINLCSSPRIKSTNLTFLQLEGPQPEIEKIQAYHKIRLNS